MKKKLMSLFPKIKHKKVFYNKEDFRNFLEPFRSQIDPSVDWVIEHEGAHYDKAKELGYSNVHFCLVYYKVNGKRVLIDAVTYSTANLHKSLYDHRGRLEDELKIISAPRELSETDIKRRDELIKILKTWEEIK